AAQTVLPAPPARDAPGDVPCCENAACNLARLWHHAHDLCCPPFRRRLEGRLVRRHGGRFPRVLFFRERRGRQYRLAAAHRGRMVGRRYRAPCTARLSGGVACGRRFHVRAAVPAGACTLAETPGQSWLISTIPP